MSLLMRDPGLRATDWSHGGGSAQRQTSRHRAHPR